MGKEVGEGHKRVTVLLKLETWMQILERRGKVVEDVELIDFGGCR